MQAIWRILGWLGAALGVVAWVGGAILFAATLLSRADVAFTTPMGGARGGLIIAGVAIALIGSVVLLRVTRSAIGFVVCFACGMLACLAAAEIDPSSFAEDTPLGSLAALGVFALAAIVLGFTRKMVPFLATLGVAGLIAVVGLTSLSAPASMAGRAPQIAAQAPPPMVDAAPMAPAPTDESRMAEAERGAEEALRNAQTDMASGGGAGAAAKPAEPEIMAGAGAPQLQPRARTGATRSFATQGSDGDDHLAAAPPPAAMAEEQVAAAAAPATEIAAPEATDFQVAELQFNKPAEMSLGQSYVVDAVIATPGAAAPLTLGNVGPTESRETQITRNVRVELVASDFDITPLHKVETVLIAPGTAGHWSWRVKPLYEGADRKMILQVFGVLERAGVPQGEILIKTYEEKILVKVTPMKRVELFSQSVVALWQPIAALFGVIGGIWMFFTKLASALRKRGAEA
ncbi:MAG: hypothetical protein AB7M12_09125 [Hyphomonadaceae bacterium]